MIHVNEQIIAHPGVCDPTKSVTFHADMDSKVCVRST